MKFRQDINGIRAFAVVAVVLYHFGVAGFSGGFVGVDVFFVLSGYLMTGIIFRKLDTGTLSLPAFYLARAKRIIPALLVVCLVVLVLGVLFLLPSDLAELRKHVTSSILFYSNMFYWKDVDYFAAAANEKWLLHTWSLSVEWQFYLLYPAAILLLKRVLTTDSIKKLLLMGTVASFCLSVWASGKMPVAAYYLLPTRAWEMLAGGLVFCYSPTLSSCSAKVSELIGLLIIVLSIVTFDHSMAWPGYLAALPVAGTMLVLWGNQQSSLFTANPLAQYLGKVSYSVYLWHWPVVVACYYLGVIQNPVAILAGTILSLCLGTLSFYGVEEPVRKLRLTGSPYRLLYPLGAAVLVVSGVNLWSSSYVNQPLDTELQTYTNCNF